MQKRVFLSAFPVLHTLVSKGKIVFTGFTEGLLLQSIEFFQFCKFFFSEGQEKNMNAYALRPAVIPVPTKYHKAPYFQNNNYINR